jgi:hypothetical protein
METNLIGHKSGIKIVFTDKVTTLYRAEIIQSINTLKYSYKQAQYNIKNYKIKQFANIKL